MSRSRRSVTPIVEKERLTLYDNFAHYLLKSTDKKEFTYPDSIIEDSIIVLDPNNDSVPFEFTQDEEEKPFIKVKEDISRARTLSYRFGKIKWKAVATGIVNIIDNDVKIDVKLRAMIENDSGESFDMELAFFSENVTQKVDKTYVPRGISFVPLGSFKINPTRFYRLRLWDGEKIETGYHFRAPQDLMQTEIELYNNDNQSLTYVSKVHLNSVMKDETGELALGVSEAVTCVYSIETSSPVATIETDRVRWKLKDDNWKRFEEKIVVKLENKLSEEVTVLIEHRIGTKRLVDEDKLKPEKKVQAGIITWKITIPAAVEYENGKAALSMIPNYVTK